MEQWDGQRHETGGADCGSGDDGVDRVEAPRELASIRGDDLDATVEIESAHEPPKMIGPRRPAFDQQDPQIGTRSGDDKPGNSTAAAEVCNDARRVREGDHERRRVVDDLLDGSLTEHAEAL